MTRIFVYEFLSGGAPLPDGAATASLLEAGIAMRDAMVEDLLGLPGVSVTCAVSGRAGPPCPAGPRLACVAPREDEAPEDFVRRLAGLHDHAWVVAPESGGALARLHAAVGEPRWIGCTADAIRTASSKRATVAALAAAGLPTPMGLGPEAGGRWIVKPDDGAGAVDTRVHPSREAALADLHERERAGRASKPGACRAWGVEAKEPASEDSFRRICSPGQEAGERWTAAGFFLEPYIEGEALSVSLLAGAAGAEVIALNRQRIAVDAEGRVSDLGVLHHAIDPSDARAAALRQLAADVVRALPGLRGYVGIDVVWHPAHGPVVIEVNPRLTCAYAGLSATLGRNLAADILALHAITEVRDAATA